MQKIFGLVFISLIPQLCFAQDVDPDSARTLEQVVITAFEQNRKLAQSPISVSKLQPGNADRYNKNSLVNGLNTIAGVRMEERSPASYRINIRGSSLRSPFGVRNVKVYWNNIPVTDPGGNTYFNQFAFNNFSSIEIYKGPASSMYGGGTGGLILMQSLEGDRKSFAGREYVTGSYGLQNILASNRFGQKEDHLQLTFAHNQSSGYRDHSKMRRDNASFVSQNIISERQQLTASVLFTSLFYETPGGLTKAEFITNPKAARPAAGGLPSADQAKAAIYQTNFLSGFNHLYSFTEHLKNSTSLYGAFAQIKNPTFRNYERRSEPHFGGRTSFNFNKKWNETVLQLVAGGELQQGYFNTQVSKNRNGNPDTLQTNDDIRYNNNSIFFQADADINKEWIFTAGLSLNKAEVDITRLNKYPVIKQSRTYRSEWAPRLALLKKITGDLSLYGNVTKGFSPPTIAELLPSTGTISTFLEAEQGTNYELGAKLYALKGQLYIEAAVFYFKLNNALVVRKDSTNADYYVNAGNAKQKGLEISTDYRKTFSNSFLKNLTASIAYSRNNFKYGDFKKESTDFKGKLQPGVPKHTLSILADLRFKRSIYFNSTWYYASKIFLNDANTASADEYKLLGLRLGWRLSINEKFGLNLYGGADNILNETYSLGNDINAAGGRYYNAAPKRNYYAGVAVELKWQ